MLSCRVLCPYLILGGYQLHHLILPFLWTIRMSKNIPLLCNPHSTCLHKMKRHTNKNSPLISPHCIHNQRRHPTNENSVGIHQNHVGICAKEPPPPLTEDTNAALEGFLKCRGCWRRMGEQAQIVSGLFSSFFVKVNIHNLYNYTIYNECSS